ncbi:MAG: pyruvate oxidase [Thalassospira sp.]|uniref:thiamine pyrophosphate-binding protein n=1 Tax=unclassified Thalassospira TaxID=2648997 RepID=UPI000C532517|nr:MULTISPECIES: thiamine pyrophosphate-dependent enzyme [unclassified Thalassospira]MBE70289.1 pyruvate oxidase [Thalassospira sp.]QPO13111.1 pyruvate oxidase [Thalassospira sp. A40-3]|tara:strand:+ start:1550 stop:3226 length:1677 start_codon:yes stop_codon:yes gene_type:complete
MKVADIAINLLSDLGVKHVFGIPGDAINDITFALENRDEIDFVLVRHEEGGAFAASAQAKLTGNLSCCVGTAGGGAIHLLNGLYDARHDHAPVLAITGQVDSEFIGTEYHQEVDLKKLFEDVTVYSETIMDPAQAPRILKEACKAAIENRAPAHVCIPNNIASADCAGDPINIATLLATREVSPSSDNLDHAAKLIDQASKPVILAGIGGAEAAQEIFDLAHRIDAPIVRTLRAKDWLDDDDPICIGGLGLLGGKPGQDSVEDCDLLCIIGADFPYQEFFPKDAKTIQIDSNRSQIGKRLDIDAPLIGSAKLSVQGILDRVPPKDTETQRKHWIDKVKDQQDDWSKIEKSDKSPLHPASVMSAIGDHAADNAIFLVDTGTTTAWAARHLRVKRNQRFTLSSGLGTMAFALSGANGAQLAYPDRQVIAIAGDGAFNMLMGELLTAAEYDLPITAVVFDNSKLGFIALEQEAKGLPEHAIAFKNPDMAAIAQACGCLGLRAENIKELSSALSQAFASKKPTVIQVPVDPDALIMPPNPTFSQAQKFAVAKGREMLGKLRS